MYDQILSKYNLKYEDLTTSEKETLTSWVSTLNKNELTMDKVRDFISNMRDGVSHELENEPEYIWVFIFKFENRRQILLKARLRNYRLILAMLASPEKAQRALHEALSNIHK